MRTVVYTRHQDRGLEAAEHVAELLGHLKFNLFFLLVFGEVLMVQAQLVGCLKGI